MIVGDIKPLEEIVASIEAYRKILIIGCGSCVSVCLSGGEREAEELRRELSSRSLSDLEDPPEFATANILRQCEKDLVNDFQKLPEGTDAVLSLACGAGVQTLADVFDPVPVYPALNTTFLGASDKPGEWSEKCRGCGDCVLTRTAGICPVARCAKSLFNGPCGGSQGGYCEIGTGAPCAWTQIYARLKKTGQLQLIHDMHGCKDWALGGGLGPRKRVRPGIGDGANKWR
jgi:ferredoxin